MTAPTTRRREKGYQAVLEALNAVWYREHWHERTTLHGSRILDERNREVRTWLKHRQGLSRSEREVFDALVTNGWHLSWEALLETMELVAWEG